MAGADRYVDRLPRAAVIGSFCGLEGLKLSNTLIPLRLALDLLNMGGAMR